MRIAQNDMKNAAVGDTIKVIYMYGGSTRAQVLERHDDHLVVRFWIDDLMGSVKPNYL